MSMSRVSVLVQTPALSLAEISAALEITPSRGTSVGDAVSSNSPPGHVRKHTTWSLDSSESEELDLGPHVVGFTPVLERLRAFDGPPLTISLSVMAYANGTEQPLFIGPDVLNYLSDIPCGISIDMFNELGWNP